MYNKKLKNVVWLFLHKCLHILDWKQSRLKDLKDIPSIYLYTAEELDSPNTENLVNCLNFNLRELFREKKDTPDIAKI